MKNRLLLYIAASLFLSVAAEARPNPIDNKEDMGSNQSSFRNLITDCLERSDANSCHKAGVYMLTYRDKQQEALKYIDNACELGKGTSCKYLGDMYAKHYKQKSQDYYEKGCLRQSVQACRKAKKK